MKRRNLDQELQRREGKIIDFVKNSPYCSKDSLFTKGRIPKSKATYELIKKLISENKIKMRHTVTGKEILFLDYSDRQKYFEHELGDLEYELNDLAKEVPKFTGLSSMFSIYSKLRLKILKYGSKNAGGLGKAEIYSTLDTFLKIFDFIEHPIPSTHTKLLNFLKSEIQRDEYFWAHERHASGDSRRSLDKLLEIKSNPHKFRLKNRDYKNHMKKIPNDPNMLFNRWFAEMLRSSYDNSEAIPKLLFKRKIKERLQIIKNDHSESDNYKLEIKNLELLSDLFKKMSVSDIINDPKYGSEFLLKPILGKKYEETMNDNYSATWMQEYLKKYKNI